MKNIIFVFLLTLLIIVKNFPVPDDLQNICPNGCKKYYYCNEETKKCEFKGFFPIYPLELLQLFLLLISSSLSTSCGIGGGTIYSSILLWVEQFDPSEAFPVSNFLIFLCGIITYISFTIDKYKHPNNKFVNYDMAMIFGVSMLLGTKFGAILNKILSNFLLVIFLNALLCFTCYKTYKNILKVKSKEKREHLLLEKDEKMNNLITQKVSNEKNLNSPKKDKINEKKDEDDENVEQNIIDLSLIFNNSFISIARSSINQRNSIRQSSASEAERIISEQNNPINWSCLYFLLSMEGIVVLDQLLEGSEKIPSIIGIKKCSKIYWFIFFLYVIITIYFIYYSIQKVQSDIKKKEKYLTNFKSDISDNLAKHPIKIALVGVFAGIVSCSCGIGGGIITNPVFFSLGMDSIESSCTSNFLIIVSCLASSFIYILAGQLKIVFGLILGGLCLSASFIGNHFILSYINRTGKSSALLVIMEYFLLFSWIVALYKLFTVDTEGYGLIKSIFKTKDYC